MPAKLPSFTDQIRRAIDASGMSRYQICKDVELSEATMSRFMSRKGGLSMEVLDRVAALLGFILHVKGNGKKDK
jgi:ribosome-binding protein aMBF1 (putative translation factor)